MTAIGAKRLSVAGISIAICGLLCSCGSAGDLFGLNSNAAPAEGFGNGRYTLIRLEPAGTTGMIEPRELSAGDAIAEIARYQPPEGVSVEGLQQLKAALVAMFTDMDSEKLTSTPPAGERNEIFDLTLTGSDEGGWQLQWPYTNVGDYDLNGEVGVSDLTPIGVHFGLSDEADDWLAASMADGDENGEVGVSDITPIGQNFLAQVGGYSAYGAHDPDGPWMPVASGALPAMPKDMPVRLFLELPEHGYAFYHVRPYDYGDFEGEPSWLTTAPGEPADVQLGEDAELVSLVIGADGGTIEGPPESPIEGISVEFPPGALAEDAEVLLGYNDGQVIVDGEADGLILVLDVGDVYEFAAPARITMPFDGDEDSIPLMFDIEEDGGLEGLQLAEINYSSGQAVFDTFHASRKLALQAYAVDKDSNPPRLPTRFKYLDNNFIIANRRTAYTGGNCLGMITFAKWYLDEEVHETDGELYESFRARVDPYLKDPPIGQDVIATRAQISVNRYWQEYGIKIVAQGYTSGDKYNFNALINMMKISGRPQVLQLRNSVDDNFDGDTGSHAVLVHCVLWDLAHDRALILIYDPNLPGRTEAIQYTISTQQFTPVELGSGTYDKVIHFGTGTIRYAESFYDILVDARQNFQGSNNATIEVLSHESGAHVQDRSIDLFGKIYSGEVLVERLGIKNDSFSAEYDVDTSGEFNASVPVFKGKNVLLFNARGYDEDNRLRVLQHNLITNPFVIEGDFDGEALSIELSWDYAEYQSMHYFARNTTSGEYCSYELSHQTTSDGGEFWSNPTQDPAGYGPEYFTLEFTDPISWGEEYEIWVRCDDINKTVNDKLWYRLVITQNEGTPAEQRRVVTNFFDELGGATWFEQSGSWHLDSIVRLTQP